MYSDGCGEDSKKVWVTNGNGPVLLNSLSPQTITTDEWNVTTEGVCQYCDVCARGSYNVGCNKNYGDDPGPRGQ